MFRTRYTKYLESEIERLKLELERSTLERQAAVNSLLAHIGAPTMQIGTPERRPTPDTKKRNAPSLWRRAQEMASRIALNKQQAEGKVQ